MDTESLGICAYLYVGQEQNNGSSKRYGLIWSAFCVLCVVFYIHQFCCMHFIHRVSKISLICGLENQTKPRIFLKMMICADTVILTVALVLGTHA